MTTTTSLGHLITHECGDNDLAVSMRAERPSRPGHAGRVSCPLQAETAVGDQVLIVGDIVAVRTVGGDRLEGGRP